MYRVEVSKVVGISWLFIPENAMERLGHSRDWSLPLSARVQTNLEVIHAIIRLMCEISQKISGGFLNLRLAYVYPKVMIFLIIDEISLFGT